HAQCVFFLVVREAAPRAVDLGKDNGPLVFVRNHVQAVSPAVEWFALNGDGIGERDGGVFVCTGAPYLSKGDKIAPDFAIAGERPMIVDGDIGYADALRHRRMLALAR